ncbi:MAG: 2-oxo-4-hydroxy-4-carboxy-5-ureidoimidazoline decarboxylase [Sneathiella sp.]|nr:2-oxo-4-hydroxy-4-carboxy-5-ureidoimidazoline decarboxylase [Sneathiella sp.]
MTTFKNKPSDMDKDQFIESFGGIYEHSSWVAVQAWGAGVSDDRRELASIMAGIVNSAGHQKKLDLINAHPDLAGKAAVQGKLTVSSTSEQTSAGLGECTVEEFENFQNYNAAYKEKFGFPFIKAVKNSNRHEILSGFENRLGNSADEEFKTALLEIDKIAAFRLEEL